MLRLRPSFLDVRAFSYLDARRIRISVASNPLWLIIMGSNLRHPFKGFIGRIEFGALSALFQEYSNWIVKICLNASGSIWLCANCVINA